MIELNQHESQEINGGSFAMDVGWLLGHALNGSFGSLYGLAMAIVDYQILYTEK